MFDDLITRDENFYIQQLNNLHQGEVDYNGTLDQVSETVRHTAENFFSKDSESFQLMHGRSGTNTVVDRSSYFHTQFPRKSTNLDSDYHYVRLDSEVLTRWIPRDILKIFIPVLYFEDLRREEEMKRLSKKNGFQYLMIARPVPTMEELSRCASLKGKGLWDRGGTWLCTSSSTPITSETDEYGPKTFESYNSWITWNHDINAKIDEAKNVEDWDTVKKLRDVKNVSRPVGRK
ncbi:uncharacterized protein RJT21DRAFT_121076 [Scheffersomyces amazonensis]|uniref:uncharacterized protein n=1 Tax=Scheffersomyces amazonensis TaxID=1078765 RepID=UPI00315D2765